MNATRRSDKTQRPSALISLAIFVAATALMVWLKLSLFPDRYTALSYALPLLVCLWHKDRRLLWAMVVTFAALSLHKDFSMEPGHNQSEPFDFLQWLMQMLNIVAVAGTVHAILNLTDRLRARNEELRARGKEIARQNGELQAQSEELAQQNEELQQQGEELAQQNEELQQRAEELERQSEELQRQAEELQAVNLELNHKEGMLTTLLGCLSGARNEPQILEQVCRALLDLIGPSGAIAAVLERAGDELVLRMQAGSSKLSEARRPFARSVAAVVLEHDRTAFVDDLAARPDLSAPMAAQHRFRSVLATPLRLNGRHLGTVNVYSLEPRKWTSQQFRIIEWVAAQCSLALGIMRLQEELAWINSRLEDQVRERTANLREMVNELEHFSYTITHDMRAPLRAISGFIRRLEELLGTRLDGETKDCMQRIASSANRMDRLVTDSLSYSKTVQTELVLGPVDAANLLRGIIDSYPNLQSPKAHIQIDSEIPRVLANEAGLTQCFSNLLDNAVKFVEPGAIAEVRVRAESRGGLVRIWFEDNGIGIPEPFRARLFQMFQRASRAYEGTGIGLALVKKMAEKMGGQAGVEFTGDTGSRFWLEFKPAAPAGMQIEAQKPRDAGSRLFDSLPNGHSEAARIPPDEKIPKVNKTVIAKTILYVEDEENDVYFMRQAFRQAGLESSLRVVTDGRAAMDYLSGHGQFANRSEFPTPTVVLLDLNLPMVSGFQVLKWIRSQPEIQQLPVVIFSSSARPDDKTQAKQLGASDYLEKPGSGREFRLVAEALCARWQIEQTVGPNTPCTEKNRTRQTVVNSAG